MSFNDENWLSAIHAIFSILLKFKQNSKTIPKTQKKWRRQPIILLHMKTVHCDWLYHPQNYKIKTHKVQQCIGLVKEEELGKLLVNRKYLASKHFINTNEQASIYQHSTQYLSILKRSKLLPWKMLLWQK